MFSSQSDQDARLQRKQRIEAVSQKRRSNLAYLKKVHEGGCFWFNVVFLSKADILHYVEQTVPRQRVDAFYSLGTSIYRILDLHYEGRPLDAVRAFSQLMEEWEYHHAGTAMQSMKFMMAKQSPCIYPQTHPIDSSAAMITDMQRPSVYRFNSIVVYEYLLVPHIPFELDYIEVLTSLCDALTLLYEYFRKEEQCFNSTALYDTVIRLDGRFKHHVINVVAKEITEFSSSIIRFKTGLIDIS